MGKLSVFNFISLNGFYKGLNEDISWHRHGAEESDFASDGAKSQGILLFGRVTYEMMVSFWPTPDAIKNIPEVAEGMNKAKKIVFSTTLEKPEWNNTQLIKGNLIEEIKKLKLIQDENMTILGSGSIVRQCADQGLIDDYQIMIDPVAIGEGTPLFKGISNKLDLKLISTKTFKSGVVLLNYKPI